MNTPLVTVCIPVHNGENYIRAALESVARQTYPNIEIFVNNDGSKDSTREIINEFIATHPIRTLVREAPKAEGVSLSWRAACAGGTGEYIKVLCHDDILHPECVAEQVAAMQANPGVSLVACRRRVIDGTGQVLLTPGGCYKKTGVYDGKKTARWCIRTCRNWIGEPMAGLFKRADMELCGNYSLTVDWFIDLDLWVKLLQRGDFYYMDKSLTDFRMHAGSNTLNVQRRIIGALASWEESLHEQGLIRNSFLGKLTRRGLVLTQGVLRDIVIRFALYTHRRNQ